MRRKTERYAELSGQAHSSAMREQDARDKEVKAKIQEVGGVVSEVVH